jgi:hypothetical protein
VYSPNTTANGIMINMHSMEYYFLWQLRQYSDNLEGGPYGVCFLPEERDLLSVQNIRPALGTSGPLFSGCCGMKQLINEADHSVLFPAEVTDQCSCNCTCPVCFHGVHTAFLTFYHSFRGITSISVYM